MALIGVDFDKVALRQKGMTRDSVTASERKRRLLFMPNWVVRSSPSNEFVQQPDKVTSGAPYWFFRWFASDPVVDILDIGQPPAAGLEEKYLHFYAMQAMRANVRLLRGDYDCVICHGAQSAVGLLALGRLKTFHLPPTIVIDVGALNHGRPDKTVSFNLTRWALRSASAIVWHATSSLEMCATHAPELMRIGISFPSVSI